METMKRISLPLCLLFLSSFLWGCQTTPSQRVYDKSSDIRIGDANGLLGGLNDRLPKALYMPLPNYPRELEHRNIPDAEVVIGFVIAEDGRTTERQVLYSSDWRFEQAALDALARAEFEPALKHGRPARCRLAIPVRFVQLKDTETERAEKTSGWGELKSIATFFMKGFNFLADPFVDLFLRYI